MALKALMLRHSIDQKTETLEALRAKNAEFSVRESELEAAINEVETEEQEQAVSAEVEQFKQEKAEHEKILSERSKEIEDLEAQLAEIEADAPALREKPETKIERTDRKMDINIRSLPMNKRAFDAFSMEERRSMVERADVQEFLAQLRSMKGQSRAVTGAELTIPVVFLELVAENMYRYSKLLNRVRVRNVSGETRQTIAGTVPEAVWTEMCTALN